MRLRTTRYHPLIAFGVAALIAALLVCPAVAACMGFMLEKYLNNPQSVIGAGAPLAGCRMVMAQIAAVHPDAQPLAARWRETGIVQFTTLESTDATVPKSFSVRYEERRDQFNSCFTWDNIDVKNGAKLVVFVRRDPSVPSGWSVPDINAGGVVARVDWMKPEFLARVEGAFRAPVAQGG